jgi:hypothetical protein
MKFECINKILKKMKNSELIKKLSACIAACNNCADKCLDHDGMAQCIRTDIECATICSALLTLHQHKLHNAKLLEACIEACKKCADDCRNHDHDHCQACAKACDECVEACESHR